MKHTHYTIGVLTNVTGQSMQDLQKTASENGVVFEQITFPSIPLTDFTKSELVKKISSYDVVYYRTGMLGPVIDELSHVLDSKNIPYVNGVSRHSYLHQKIRQALIADRYTIPQPKSFIVSNYKYKNVASVLGPTFVIKPDDGSKGNEVALIKSEEELTDFKNRKKKDRHLYQEYIENAEEYRVYTVGGKGIATYKKVLGDEDFRANMHVGASMTSTEPERTGQLLEFGGYVSRCFGADISGVDILIKDGKCLFLELNWQPGWAQLDTLTGTDFCEETIQYLLKKAHQNKSFWRKFIT